MTDRTVLLDPTAEIDPEQRMRTPRPESLDTLTVGLLDISKPRGDVFLDALERHIQDRGISVKRYQKPAYTRVAPTELRQQISMECDVAVEALAD